jgi:addiction module HigA family antidote
MFIDIHPGRVLKEELEARNLSGNALAIKIRVPPQRIHEILHGRRAMTPDTALRLGRYFGMSAQFWMDLQTAHDLAKVEAEIGAKIEAEIERAA